MLMPYTTTGMYSRVPASSGVIELVGRVEPSVVWGWGSNVYDIPTLPFGVLLFSKTPTEAMVIRSTDLTI